MVGRCRPCLTESAAGFRNNAQVKKSPLIAVAAMTFVVGSLLLRETKDQGIWHEVGR